MTDLPVVDIHISVYDVLRTMKLAENYSSLYAIVGFPSITEPAHTLCSLLDFNLDILTVNNAAEVRHTLERLQQGGYRMVVCDMVTHTIAQEMGFDAFLITSGVESLHAAIDQAVNISSWFGQLRQENLFLRSITQGQNGRVIVMESNGDLFYSSISEVPAELSSVLQSHIREIPASGNLRFYYTDRDQLYSITAQQLLMNNIQRCLFYCVPARIPLHSSRPGLRTLNKGECEYLFANSFYSLSGAMGTQAAEIRSLALLRQPVFIYGEPGTGKEQIARYLYLHSSLANHPFIVVNCALLNEKTWDFLLNHYNSPLSATGNTIYFQNFESISPQWSSELLAAIEETGLARRVRLIFSCSIVEGEPVPEVLRHFSERLGSLALPLPSLRSRSDEIPSLSSLYLNSLNSSWASSSRASSPGPSRCSASTPGPTITPSSRTSCAPSPPCRTAPTSGPGRWPICFPKSGLCGPCRSRLLPASPVSRPSKKVIRDVVQQPSPPTAEIAPPLPSAGHQPHDPLALYGKNRAETTDCRKES